MKGLSPTGEEILVWRWVWSLRIGSVFTGNNLFLLKVGWTKAKIEYSLHRTSAGRTLHCGKQALRSWTRFVIPHKWTLQLVENKMKDDSWQSDFFPLASRPLPVAFVPLLSPKCIFRCHEGFSHRWTSFWRIVLGEAAGSLLTVADNHSCSQGMLKWNREAPEMIYKEHCVWSFHFNFLKWL